MGCRFGYTAVRSPAFNGSVSQTTKRVPGEVLRGYLTVKCVCSVHHQLSGYLVTDQSSVKDFSVL